VVCSIEECDPSFGSEQKPKVNRESKREKQELEDLMSPILTRTHIGANVPLTLLALFVTAAPNALAGHSKKPPEQPVAVIAHLALPGASASQMLLQERDGKKFLYAVRNSGKGYTIVEVTNPSQPSLVKRVAWPDGALAGRFQTVSATLGIAEGSAANSSAMRPEPPPESLELVDLSDPANPRTIKSFSGVTSVLADDARNLIYITNGEGLWILKHQPEKPALRACTSGDAEAPMPNCGQ
jgi:LVIVD repeat